MKRNYGYDPNSNALMTNFDENAEEIASKRHRMHSSSNTNGELETNTALGKRNNEANASEGISLRDYFMRFKESDNNTSLTDSRGYKESHLEENNKSDTVKNTNEGHRTRSETSDELELISNTVEGETSHQQLPNTVINLSTTPLDFATESILAKGLDFALTPRLIPYETVICSVEKAIICNKLPPSDAEALRQDVAVILTRAELPEGNITTEESTALEKIHKNDDVLVLKADKGNSVVVMNAEDYHGKVRDLLMNKRIYKSVPYNPTARITRRIRAIIREYKDIFDEDVFARLISCKKRQPPKLYGLPQVHKPNIPLHPIVSQIEEEEEEENICIQTHEQIASPTYDLAKHVASVLQPLVGKTSSYVKDSRHFVQIIKGMKLEPDDIMVCFEVDTLFTNIPIKECLEVIRQRLQFERMSQSYMVLLQKCVEGNYFLYRGQYYLQIDGVATGSPLASVIADIWMEYFEATIDLQTWKVKLWKRYVGDIFCVLKGGKQEVDQFSDYLNSVHSNLRFTYELEADRCLAFLDVKVMVGEDGSLVWKLTHTDRYLNAKSHHHPRHLQSVMVSLFKKARSLCDSKYIDEELSHVQELLKRNGYKVDAALSRRKCRRKHYSVSRQPAFLPYLRGVTDNIGTVLDRFSIKTVFTPFFTIARMLGTPKDVIPYQTPGVYKIECSCNSSYIGETKRAIADRVKEHKAAVKQKQADKSAIAKHLLESPDHQIKLDRPKVLSTEREFYKRLVREAVEMKKYKNFNRNNGYKLSTSWDPVIRKCTLTSICIVGRIFGYCECCLAVQRIGMKIKKTNCGYSSEILL